MDRYESMVRGELLDEVRKLDALINTPELLDFAKAVHLEAVHQEVRWGSQGDDGKAPGEWHWLVAHLATRALEHHREAQRLHVLRLSTSELYPALFDEVIAHHREKAVHHCITTAAALAHWHASMLGKMTTMRPSSATAARDLASRVVAS